MRPFHFSFALALAALLLAPPLADAASLAVTAGAALEGNFGMAITHDGTAQQAWVQDNTPDSESTYNYEFRYSFNDVSIPQDAFQNIMLIRNDAGVNQMRVFMKCLNADCGAGGGGGLVKLMFQPKRDVGGGNPWVHCAGITTSPTGNVHWRVELVKGSGADDGVCRLIRNGVLMVERLDMPIDEIDIDAHRWGALALLNQALLGTTKNDSFVSTR